MVDITRGVWYSVFLWFWKGINMGYYTNYEVTVSNFKDEKEAVYFDHKFNEMVGYFQESKIIRVNHDGKYLLSFYISDAKWYDYDNHLTSLSKSFKDVLIEVHGEGEESGDVWKARYKNGKSEFVKAIVVFPDFEEIV